MRALRNTRENRKVTRLHLDSPLRVVLGSIGSTLKYDMLTRNISTNGFFLDFDAPGRFPFTISSIMEVWLELESNNTVFFNGKMARVVQPQDPKAKESGPGIAIKIVQISSEDEQRLRHFIESNPLKLKDKKQNAG